MEHRHEPRLKVALLGVCKIGAGKRTPVMIGELSTRGCRIMGPVKQMPPNCRVSIKFGELDFLTGRIVWAVHGTAGITWTSELHPAIVDHIYEQHGCANQPRIKKEIPRSSRSMPRFLAQG